MRITLIGVLVVCSLFAFAATANAAINITFHPNSTCTAADDDTLDSGSVACAKATGLGTQHNHHIEIYDPSNVLFAISTSGTGNREVSFTPLACGVWTAKVIKDSDSSLQEQRTFTIGNCAPTTATLIVIKHVINDNGGTATASDFTLDSGGSNDSPDDFAGAESPGTTVTLDPGAYNVSETGPAGYTAAYSTDCSGTIAAGQTKTCTVTNDDAQAFVVVDKTVVNDDGGTAAPNDFLLTVDGNPASDGVALAVNPGSHTVSETNLPGYTAGAWGGDCNANGSVSVALGETKTCTITNNDIAASLTLVKEVVNDDEGTAVASDWTLTASGPTGFSGFGPSVTNSDIDAGTYDLSENGPGGYTASDWVCAGGNQTDGNTVEIALGESVTCTITNNDNEREPPPPPHEDDDDLQCRIDVIINSTGVITNVTSAISRTGGNDAGGSYGGEGKNGGDGGKGGKAKSTGGTASGGSGGTGGNANGGNGGNGGLVSTGDATSNAATQNILNRIEIILRR